MASEQYWADLTKKLDDMSDEQLCKLIDEVLDGMESNANANSTRQRTD